MRKRSRFLVPVLLFSLMMLVIPSCKDDEPAPPAKLSFAESEITVSEEDGIIEIEIVLDKAAKEDITVEYTLAGSAIDLITAGTQYSPDYEILGEYLEIEIEEGETTGVIEIELYGDYYIEDDETIEIEIESVSSDDVEITNDDDIEITLQQEGNGMIVLLDWPDPTPTASADMDLLLRTGTTIGTLGNVVAGSADGSTSPGELIFIPSSIGNAAFGLAYNYYEGTIDPLTFDVIFAEVVAGTIEAEANRATYQATYTAVNKNPWSNVNSTKVVQTFVMVSGVCSNFSAIVVPSSGSRESVQNLSSAVKKGDGSKALPRYLNALRGKN